MKVIYLNYQDEADPMNGATISNADALVQLLDDRKNEAPFLAELSGDNGYHIEFGIGGTFACVQYSRSDGELPYLVALPPHPHVTSGYVEFLTANTPTPVPARNILSFDELKRIALDFLETGERCLAFSWEPV